MEKIENLGVCRNMLQAELLRRYEALKQKILFFNQFLIEDPKTDVESILTSLSLLSISFFQDIDSLYHNPNGILSDIASDRSWINLSSSFSLASEFPSRDFACYKFKNGDQYIGEWKNGKFSGKGLYHFKQEKNYYSRFHNNDIDDGKINFINTNIYWGFFTDGIKDGWGIQIYANGNKYQGKWSNDSPNGKGKLWYTLGDYSEGIFFNGKLIGKGTERYENGDIYNGEFIKGLKCGHGVYVFASGGYYEGDWKNDEKNGKGKMVFKSGGYYEGEWKDGCKNGYGHEVYSNEETYIGYFQNGLKSGQGKYYFHSGFWTEGFWINDKILN